MKCDVLTLFPDIIHAYLGESIVKRARAGQLLDVAVVNIRDFTDDPHRSVDDAPFGGGAGMVLKPEPIFSPEVKSSVPPPGARDGAVGLIWSWWETQPV